MKLRKATPIEHRRGTAFVTRARGCTSEEILTPVYTIGPEAERLNQIRRGRNMPLRDMASRLGFRAVELSALENGRLVPEDPKAWQRILDVASK